MVLVDCVDRVHSCFDVMAKRDVYHHELRDVPLNTLVPRNTVPPVVLLVDIDPGPWRCAFAGIGVAREQRL